MADFWRSKRDTYLAKRKSEQTVKGKRLRQEAELITRWVDYILEHHNGRSDGQVFKQFCEGAAKPLAKSSCINYASIIKKFHGQYSREPMVPVIPVGAPALPKTVTCPVNLLVELQKICARELLSMDHHKDGDLHNTRYIGK